MDRPDKKKETCDKCGYNPESGSTKFYKCYTKDCPFKTESKITGGGFSSGEPNPNRHFYLYSKGWYKRGSVMNDLKKIQSDYTGVDICHLNDNLIIEKMLELAYDSVKGNRHLTLRMIKWVAGIMPFDFFKDDPQRIVRICLSVLSCTGRDIFGDLGDPDPDILPLSGT